MADSLTARPITIYRDNKNDPESEPDHIIFNNSAVSNTDFKDSSENGAYITSIKSVEPEGIGNNQAAEISDGNVQPLGVVEKTYTITGFITNQRATIIIHPPPSTEPPTITPNSLLEKLKTWKTDPQVTNGTFEAGRFSLKDEEDPTNDLVTNDEEDVLTGEGLIFQEYQKTNDYNRNRVDFVLIFRRSRGIDI